MLDVFPTDGAAGFGDTARSHAESFCKDRLGFHRSANRSHRLFREGLLRTAAAIHSLRHKFQMLWVHAGMHFAEMVEHQPVRCFTWRNGAAITFVVKTMSLLAFSVSLDQPISTDTRSELPNPALSFIPSIFNDVVYWTKPRGVPAKVFHGLPAYATRWCIIFICDGSFFTAPTMAGSKDYFHDPLSVGRHRLPRESQRLTLGSMSNALADLSQQLEYTR